MGAAKLLKMGKKYALIEAPGANSGVIYTIVDIASYGGIVDYTDKLLAAQYFLALEDGSLDPSFFSAYPVWPYEPEELPGDIVKAHDKLGLAGAASKPIGSKAPSIIEVMDKGAYKVVKLDDGTFATFIPSTGESKFGFSSLRGASRSGATAARKSAAAKLSAMGVDPGSDAVETLLGVYEGRMRAMYEQAATEMLEKQVDAYAKFLEKDKKQLSKVASGELTDEQYRRWLSGQNATQQWYRDMVDGLSADLSAANARAMQMVNGYIPEAYAANMNYGTFQIEQAAHIDTGFTLYNQNAVARLIADPETQLLPEFPDPKIDPMKDLQWCRQKISSSVTQSILQGESVPMAAQRLRGVVGMSANSAMRAARTALTGAQNAGRADAGRRAAAMGIELKKQWVATVDGRTRYSHREIDRETVELDQKFSNGCEFPGDPTAAGHEVYNCRCAMRHVMPGYEYDDLPEYTKEGIAYEEWKNERTTKLEQQAAGAKQQYDEAMAEINKLKSAMPEDKDFGGIVQGGSKASDWTPEKVASSEEYYFKKLQKAINEGNRFDIDWYKKRLAELKSYDDAGRAYHEAYSLVKPQLEKWEKQASKAKAKLAAAGNGNAYSEERRNNTKWFGSSREADDALREWTGSVWRAASQENKNAINSYTGGTYTFYNRPLNGYENGRYWEENFRGVGNVDINEEGQGEKIRRMTRYLQGSVTEQDMWLRRGDGATSLAPFFGLPPKTDLTAMSDDELRSFIGTSARIGSFQSCGTTASTGFLHKEIVIEYFVPAGSQAAYVEPFSQCGEGAGLGWDGISSQSMLGSELETILQRGGSYTLIDFRREGYKPVFVMEVHPEDGYWLFQQDD